MWVWIRWDGLAGLCCKGVVSLACCCNDVALLLWNCCVGAKLQQFEWAWAGILDKLVGFYFVALHLPVQGASINIEYAGGLGFVSSGPF